MVHTELLGWPLMLSLLQPSLPCNGKLTMPFPAHTISSLVFFNTHSWTLDRSPKISGFHDTNFEHKTIESSSCPIHCAFFAAVATR